MCSLKVQIDLTLKHSIHDCLTLNILSFGHTFYETVIFLGKLEWFLAHDATYVLLA